MIAIRVRPLPMPAIEAVIGLLLWVSPAAAQQLPLTEWLALAGRSTAVVVGIPLGPERSVELANERTPRLLREADGSYRVILRDPRDYTVGGLWRVQVEQVVKGDGRVVPAEVIDVFHQGQLGKAQQGRRYLLFLRAPIVRGDITDPVNGWKSLYGTILTLPNSPAETPFDPSSAYSVVLAPPSYARAALEVTGDSASEVEAIKSAIQAQAMPSARIVAPVAGATLRGSATLAAATADDVGVLGVQFRVDERDLGAELPPQGFVTTTWDTTTAADGRHVLVAVARDGAGNRAGSTPVPVTVDNTPPELRLAPQPVSLWPADGRLVPVVVGVTVTDSQDASPAIQLVSITCREGRKARAGVPENLPFCTSAYDIAGATPGADDREFQLRATQRSAKTVRIYTITYSARDAAGNQVTASTTVRVEPEPAPASPRDR